MTVYHRLPPFWRPYYLILRTGGTTTHKHFQYRLSRLRISLAPKLKQRPLWDLKSQQGAFYPLFPEEKYEISPPRFFGISRSATPKQRRVPAQWHALLHGATVYNPSWAVVSGKTLWQQEEVALLPYAAAGYSNHFTFNHDGARLQHSYQPLPPLAEAAIIAHRTGFNYLHALMEVLPKILMLDAYDPARRIPALVDHACSPNIVACITDFLEGRPYVVLPQEGRVKVSQLHCFSTPAYMPDDPHFGLEAGALSPHFIQQLADRLRFDPKYRVPLLFVSRTHYQQKHAGVYHIRNVLNQTLLDEAMQVHEAVIYYAEEHDWKEQRSMFAAADRVVILAGAACANLIFCKPGTKVLLIARNDKANYGFFSAMTDVLGLDTAWLLGTANKGDIHASYTIEPADLEKSLAWLMRDTPSWDGTIEIN